MLIGIEPANISGCSTSLMLRMPVSGVRSSWLTAARKASLAVLARCSSATVASSSTVPRRHLLL